MINTNQKCNGTIHQIHSDLEVLGVLGAETPEAILTFSNFFTSKMTALQRHVLSRALDRIQGRVQAQSEDCSRGGGEERKSIKWNLNTVWDMHWRRTIFKSGREYSQCITSASERGKKFEFFCVGNIIILVNILLVYHVY